MSRLSLVLMLCGWLLLSASGCRSTRMFAIDSDSRSPWFGLNFALPKPSAKRKTLETISDDHPEQVQIATADLKSIEATPAQPVRSLLPKWLGGTTTSLPLPPDAPRIDHSETVTLGGPREEFR